MLQPLLSALSMSDSDVLDEGALADVWRQMSAADEVADDLEGKLDRLIGQLGKVEEDILGDMGDHNKSKESTEKGDLKAEKETGQTGQKTGDEKK